jgi:hypothetical protein
MYKYPLLKSTINNRMSKPVTILDSVKPLYDQVTKDCDRAHASWVNTRKFTVDPTLTKTHLPFKLDTQLHTIKETTQ